MPNKPKYDKNHNGDAFVDSQEQLVPRFHSSKEAKRKLNILLTNGRFPVSLDLARQFKASGHKVYVVDPMKYHVCKFSRAVKKSWHVPAPHVDPTGYVKGVKQAVVEANIDLIVPLHEEVFHLTQLCRESPEIIGKLFAPPFDMLICLHNKWYFHKILRRFNLDAPETWLCRSVEDVENLDHSCDMALKPVFGRAKSNLYHLKANHPLPDNLLVGPDNHYVAQVWMYGKQFCTYSVARDGKMLALAIYPVQDTVDGSSCVYFKSIDHPGIRSYVETLIQKLGYTGQIALDFIETDSRLVAIECNPRATSGIHLFKRKEGFVKALTTTVDPSTPLESLPFTLAKIGAQRQLFPGMVMWQHEGVSLKQYLRHLAKLTTTRDVIFSWRDPMPSLMQPFLLTSYYEICRERKMKLGEMFQWDLTWEPKGDELRQVGREMEMWDAQSGVARTAGLQENGDHAIGMDGPTLP
ncbi:hypothetical protein SpCBS45565_g08221 [Spizellomyces sp. 'palustris']|nr:hypothetical protein SpCBS45565_g08221 [Spizellomyces sp. 'palustris']